MDINEIKQFITENKDNEEVKGFIGSFVNTDTITPFLDTEEGKKLLQPKYDKYFTKGLETWKTNNLNTLVETEISKRYPAETEEAKQIRELKEQLNGIQLTAQKEKLKNVAIKNLNEKGLPVSLADYINADTEEAINTMVEFLDVEWKQAIENTVTARLKGNTPQAGQQTGVGELTKEKIARMPVKDRMKIYNEQPEIWKKIMG